MHACDTCFSSGHAARAQGHTLTPESLAREETDVMKVGSGPGFVSCMHAHPCVLTQVDHGQEAWDVMMWARREPLYGLYKRVMQAEGLESWIMHV